MFSIELGMNERSAEHFAAIAPVAGLPHNGFNSGPPGAWPLSMLMLSGNSDTSVPPVSNDNERPDRALSADGWYYTAAASVAEQWAQRNDCSSWASTEEHFTSRDGENGLVCLARSGCRTGIDVVDCRWNGGHDYPPSGFSADIVWEFLSSHTKVRETVPTAEPTPAGCQRCESGTRALLFGDLPCCDE
jgi:poly(3-hydroxybutyrate) depolymerase